MAMESAGLPGGEVTDAQREAAIAALRTAAGEGRIDLDEFGDRAGVVYGARRLDDLRAVLADVDAADLPVPAPPPPGPTSTPAPAPIPPPTTAQYVVAVMSGADRKGTWRASAQVNAIAVMGGCKLDFRHAELSAAVTNVNAVAVMGGVEIVVPEGVPVEVDGFVLMGGIDDKTRGHPAPGAPMLRIKAYGMWGGVTVRHPRRRDRRRDAEAATPPPAPVPPAPAPAPPAAPVPPPPPPPPPPVSDPPVPATEESAPTVDDVVAAVAPVPLDGTTVTLMFTDVIESTTMAQSLGDHRWFEVLQRHNALLREEFARCGGREIKGQGDGFMVSFASARRALLCAINIQRALATHRREHPDTELHVRIGLHSGEVITEDGDLFGRNVILASRIAACAGVDQILASSVTKELADSGGDLDFADGRVVDLRGLSGQWRVHELRWS